MEELFLKLFNMSITAGWIVLAVVLLRVLFPKIPRFFRCIAWGLVAMRLVCPIALESSVSVIPSKEVLPKEMLYADAPMIDSGIPVVNDVLNAVVYENLAPEAGVSVWPSISEMVTQTPPSHHSTADPAVEQSAITPMQLITGIAALIWLIGVLVLLLYLFFSYLRIRLRVRESVRIEGNIWECDNVSTPFILGIVRPRIYLPSCISREDATCVIAHEKAHLRRLDHVWKPIGFLLLTVYWFNPLMWLAYILLCRDIELACDEKVLRVMGTDIKRSYAEALINCSASRRTITACPLAFGEVGVKRRIKAVLHYKRPSFWLVLIAGVSCLCLTAFFLTDPETDRLANSSATTEGETTRNETTTTTVVTTVPSVPASATTATTSSTTVTTKHTTMSMTTTKPTTTPTGIPAEIGQVVIDSGSGTVNGSRGLEYTRVDTGYCVSGAGDCTDTELKIPARYNGLPVIGVGESVFEGLPIVSVEFPDTISYIGDRAFASTFISNLKLPKNLRYLGAGAFESCWELVEVDIPAGILQAPDGAFALCYSLMKVTFEDGATFVGDSMFAYCNNLQEIILPESVTTIQSEAFMGCSKLYWQTLPWHIQTIGPCAFQDCWIETIHVNEEIASMNGAFAGVYSAEVEFEEGITLLAYNLFRGMRICQQITLPEGLTVIGGGAFADCVELRQVSAPSSLSIISHHAFAGSFNLESLTLPSDDIEIGDRAFAGCYLLNLPVVSS